MIPWHQRNYLVPWDKKYFTKYYIQFKAMRHLQLLVFQIFVGMTIWLWYFNNITWNFLLKIQENYENFSFYTMVRNFTWPNKEQTSQTKPSLQFVWQMKFHSLLQIIQTLLSSISGTFENTFYSTGLARINLVFQPSDSFQKNLQSFIWLKNS